MVARYILLLIAFLVPVWCASAIAEEDQYTKRLVAHVDLSAQRMHVTVEGERKFTWKISSGRSGYLTPTGTYKPTFLHRMHYSRKYDNSPMPHSVFFYKGYAVHGTNYTKRLGRPASHGCIRLAKGDAKTFFELVKRYGKAETEITLTGKAPGATRYAKKKKKKRVASRKSKRKYQLQLKRKRALALKRKRKRLAAHRRKYGPFSFLFNRY